MFNVSSVHGAHSLMTLSVFYEMLGAVTDAIRVWTDISRAKWHGSVGKLPYFS